MVLVHYHYLKTQVLLRWEIRRVPLVAACLVVPADIRALQPLNSTTVPKRAPIVMPLGQRPLLLQPLHLVVAAVSFLLKRLELIVYPRLVGQLAVCLLKARLIEIEN